MVSDMQAIEKEEGEGVPPRPVRHPVAWELADVDVDDVRRSLECGEEHPGVIPGVGYEIEATGAMFWLHESGRIYQTWATTLTCANPGDPYPTLVVIGHLGRDPSESSRVVLKNPAPGWGRGLPSEVPWQRPAG